MSFPLAFDAALDWARHPVVGLLELNPVQVLIIGAIAVLLFGKRLPEVGRSLGKGLVELRKGMRGIQDAFHEVTSSIESTDATSGNGSYSGAKPSYQQDAEDHDEATAPKFEPPPRPKSEPTKSAPADQSEPTMSAPASPEPSGRDPAATEPAAMAAPVTPDSAKTDSPKTAPAELSAG